MKKVIVIPARMGSSRFPGKPMANIHGMPMIGHVWNRCKLSKTIDEVYVATCDYEIKDYIESIGGKAIMTSNCHERCTDRTAEAVEYIEKKYNKNLDIIVMVQGDEAMVTPEMIDAAVTPMIQENNVNIVNLMTSITSIEEFRDPNEVKVVVDNNSNAIYFSREPIPSLEKCKDKFVKFKQVCIIPFKRDYLFKFNELSPTPLEKIESIDMLRLLEHKVDIRMIKVDTKTLSVDTKQDLINVEKYMKNDLLMQKYI